MVYCETAHKRHLPKPTRAGDRGSLDLFGLRFRHLLTRIPKPYSTSAPLLSFPDRCIIASAFLPPTLAVSKLINHLPMSSVEVRTEPAPGADNWLTIRRK